MTEFLGMFTQLFYPVRRCEIVDFSWGFSFFDAPYDYSFGKSDFDQTVFSYVLLRSESTHSIHSRNNPTACQNQSKYQSF
jgi:hypothetical protein